MRPHLRARLLQRRSMPSGLSHEARAAIDNGGAREPSRAEREWVLYMEGRNEDDNSAE